MPMISSQDRQTLQKLFAGLEGDVTITNFTQGESRFGIPANAKREVSRMELAGL